MIAFLFCFKLALTPSQGIPMMIPRLYEWMEPKIMIPGVKAMILAMEELVRFE